MGWSGGSARNTPTSSDVQAALDIIEETNGTYDTCMSGIVSAEGQAEIEVAGNVLAKLISMEMDGIDGNTWYNIQNQELKDFLEPNIRN